MQEFNLENYIQGLAYTEDLVTRKLDFHDETAYLVYISTMCDNKFIHTAIVDSYLESTQRSELQTVLEALPGYELVQDQTRLTNKLIQGYALLFFANETCAIDVRKPPSYQPQKATIEYVLQGPQFAFSEEIETNIHILRTRYPMQDLHVEYMKIGSVSQTQLAMVYDTSKVDDDVLLRLKNKLMQIDAEVVQATNQVQMLITKRFNLLPTAMVSERPDRAVLNLSKGKVILVLNGTPFVLIAPAVFFDFLASMDDIYDVPWFTRPLMALRYIGAFITTSLPALYVATVSYNPEVFRAQLAIEIAGSRAAVPYPSFYEVFFMLFLIEALTEASIRLPKYIGSMATTVGGLILGQAAQMAGLVSSIMIIVASMVAISNFVIPINTMNLALRVIKFPLVLLAIFFGLTGVLTGLFCFLIYTASLRSFGRPYLSLFIGEAKKSR
ncbi:spore germination protein [Brevibacillus nitrificans]|uniref:spore germination protein n=1 Tax=Brevibacillus nitrificans TaxID=651560 RepID=UPI0026256751|nr:spore germination protein [Brevibacillus nitrificans]